MEVCTNVRIEECHNVTEQQPIGARWVDIRKQDGVNPKYLSRFAPKEVKRSVVPGLYAATPPLECLRAMMPSAMASANVGATPNEVDYQ